MKNKKSVLKCPKGIKDLKEMKGDEKSHMFVDLREYVKRGGMTRFEEIDDISSKIDPKLMAEYSRGLLRLENDLSRGWEDICPQAYNGCKEVGDKKQFYDICVNDRYLFQCIKNNPN